MKSTLFLFLLVVAEINFGFAQIGRRNSVDTTTVKQIGSNRYFRIGVIPYQFLSRSSGIYFNYEFKKYMVEYRLTYTYATNYFYFAGGPFNRQDVYFFQGINNNFIFIRRVNKTFDIGFMLIQKSWWYNTEWVPVDVNSPAGTDWEQRKSTNMFGLGAGIEC